MQLLKYFENNSWIADHDKKEKIELKPIRTKNKHLLKSVD